MLLLLLHGGASPAAAGEPIISISGDAGELFVSGTAERMYIHGEPGRLYVQGVAERLTISGEAGKS